MPKSAKKIEIDKRDDDDYIRPLWVSNLMFGVSTTIGIGLVIYFSLPIPN